MSGEGERCREQPAAGVDIFVVVILGADHNRLVIEQARRDGYVRRTAGRRKVRLVSRNRRGRRLIHASKIVHSRLGFQRRDWTAWIGLYDHALG